MELDKIFQEKAEKVQEEKRLQVIISEEAVIDDLMAYFQQTSPLAFCASSREDFEYYKEYLKNFQVTPSIIIMAYPLLRKQRISGDYLQSLFLSAMIQTSYNQGFNNFDFEEMNLGLFCGNLQGKTKNKIKIKSKKIGCATVLYNANNIALIAEEINGDLHLAYAQSCVAEIQNYKGTRFGQGMKNCKIYSPNPETLETIKKQIVNGKNNKFIIGTMPEESKKWA